MNRCLVLALLLAGCMSRFVSGPARSEAVKTATVRVEGCTTPASLFDCKSAPAVADWLRDLFKLNGIAEGPQATAFLKITEDQNVVAVSLTLGAGGRVVWKAEGQGDTLLRALVRLETVLEEEAGLKERFLRSEDVMKVLGRVGRKELSAERNTFTYR